MQGFDEDSFGMSTLELIDGVLAEGRALAEHARTDEVHPYLFCELVAEMADVVESMTAEQFQLFKSYWGEVNKRWKEHLLAWDALDDEYADWPDAHPIRITPRDKQKRFDDWNCISRDPKRHRRGADSDPRKQWRRNASDYRGLKLDFQQWIGNEADGFHDWDDGFEQADNSHNGIQMVAVDGEDLKYMLTFEIISPKQVKMVDGVPMLCAELGVDHW